MARTYTAKWLHSPNSPTKYSTMQNSCLYHISYSMSTTHIIIPHAVGDIISKLIHSLLGLVTHLPNMPLGCCTDWCSCRSTITVSASTSTKISSFPCMKELVRPAVDADEIVHSTTSKNDIPLAQRPQVRHRAIYGKMCLQDAKTSLNDHVQWGVPIVI